MNLKTGCSPLGLGYFFGRSMIWAWFSVFILMREAPNRPALAQHWRHGRVAGVKNGQSGHEWFHRLFCFCRFDWSINVFPALSANKSFIHWWPRTFGLSTLKQNHKIILPINKNYCSNTRMIEFHTHIDLLPHPILLHSTWQGFTKHERIISQGPMLCMPLTTSR